MIYWQCAEGTLPTNKNRYNDSLAFNSDTVILMYSPRKQLAQPSTQLHFTGLKTNYFWVTFAVANN